MKKAILDEIDSTDPMRVTETLTHTRTFTKIDDNGMVSDGSLRKARCIDKGLYFYGEMKCLDEDRRILGEALSFVKYVGSMRNRGFGKVKISMVPEG